MKRIITGIIAASLCLAAAAQTAEDYSRRYRNLVARVGFDGIGVSSLIDSWEKADSAGIDPLVARFSYHFARSRRDSVVSKPGRKYLGMEPVLTLKDSTGNDINWFKEPVFDASEFNQAISYLDMAISSDNTRLDLLLTMADSFLQYEKGRPVQSLAQLTDLVDRHFTEKPVWTYRGTDVIDDGDFCGEIQGRCFEMYSKGTDEAYEAFRSLSERVLKYDRNNVNFINNIGAYYLVCRGNDKTALKYYRKSLKIKPDDETAQKNIRLIERRAAATAKGR